MFDDGLAMLNEEHDTDFLRMVERYETSHLLIIATDFLECIFQCNI